MAPREAFTHRAGGDLPRKRLDGAYRTGGRSTPATRPPVTGTPVTAARHRVLSWGGWGRAAGEDFPFACACHGSPPPARLPCHHAEHFHPPQPRGASPNQKPGQVHLMRQTARCGMRAISATTVCDICASGVRGSRRRWRCSSSRASCRSTAAMRKETRQACPSLVRACWGADTTMPGGKRCFPGGTVFQVRNRGNIRQTRFFGSADYEAFVRIVKEAWLIAPMRILGYGLMPCDPWVEQTARHRGLEATPRSRGRPPKKRSSRGKASSHDNNIAPEKQLTRFAQTTRGNVPVPVSSDTNATNEHE
jgi:hypothetical protein